MHGHGTLIITALCFALTSLYLSQYVHCIILHHLRCSSGTYDCQILCFRADLPIGISTNSSITAISFTLLAVFSFVFSMARHTKKKKLGFGAGIFMRYCRLLNIVIGSTIPLNWSTVSASTDTAALA